MDRPLLVCYPNNDTRSLRNSVCCVLITFSSLLNLLSNSSNHNQNTNCCSPLNLRYIYWTERGGDSPRIVQAGLDGSHVEPLITENIRHPNGLTVDYTAQRLYWSDGYYGTVQSSWLNGSDRSTIVNGTGKFEPYGVAVLDNHVYWTDRATNSLNSVHKLMGGEERVILEGLSRPSGIAVLNSDAQPPGT